MLEFIKWRQFHPLNQITYIFLSEKNKMTREFLNHVLSAKYHEG